MIFSPELSLLGPGVCFLLSEGQMGHWRCAGVAVGWSTGTGGSPILYPRSPGLGAEKNPPARGSASACAAGPERQRKGAPPAGRDGVIWDQNPQCSASSARQSPGTVLRGLLTILRGFEGGGRTQVFDAVGKGRPQRCGEGQAQAAWLSPELWWTPLSHSDVCLTGPGLEHCCAISPPGPQPIDAAASPCITEPCYEWLEKVPVQICCCWGHSQNSPQQHPGSIKKTRPLVCWCYSKIWCCTWPT